jgi:hypothetical protein
LSASLKIRFVTGLGGNYHMTELLSALCAVAREAGYDAELERSIFPPSDPRTAYVFIPHEHYTYEPRSAWPSREQRERTIALFVENPGTFWFDLVCDLAAQFPRVLAINRTGVAELHRRGVPAEHLQLGYTPHWDRWHGEDHPRPIDVTYLGAADPRRDALIAGYGRWFCRRRTAMLMPTSNPKPSARPDYLADDDKYIHLRQAKLLVNLHRDRTCSLEWVRALQAIANGCVVVSEPSVDHAPLVPGEHFVVAAAESIPHVVHGLLGDPERLEAIRTSAYDVIRRELDMSSAVEALVTVAEQLVSKGCGHPLPESPPRPDQVDAQPDPGKDAAQLLTAVRDLATETLQLRRDVKSLLERSEGRDPDGEPERVAFTPAYVDAQPRVSVAITLHNREHEVLDALRCVGASEFDDYEVLVLDDSSQDGSLAAVRDFLTEQPWLPAALLRHRVNRGLGASRNALARRARGELMFVLDADNTIYPTALGRLVEKLDEDPGAAFVYPLLCVTRSGEPVALTSRYAWDPDGFRHGNYIDAMALIRLDDYTALGGYTEDIRLTGWEDFYFWCACAETGRRGKLLPEVLAQYRDTDHSMLAWTERTDITAAWSLMHARFPTIVPAKPGG